MAMLPMKVLKDYYETEEYNRFISGKNSLVDFFSAQKEILKIKGTISQEDAKQALKLTMDAFSSFTDSKTLIQSAIDGLRTSYRTLGTPALSKKTYLAFLRLLFEHLEKKCGYGLIIQKTITNGNLWDIPSKRDFKWEVNVTIESVGSHEMLSPGFKEILVNESNKFIRECRQYFNVDLFDISEYIDVIYVFSVTQGIGNPQTATLARAYKDKSSGQRYLILQKTGSKECIKFFGNDVDNVSIYPDKNGFNSSYNYFNFFRQEALDLVNIYSKLYFGHYESTN